MSIKKNALSRESLPKTKRLLDRLRKVNFAHSQYLSHVNPSFCRARPLAGAKGRWRG